MPAWSAKRVIEIDAPTSKVYEIVSDYRTWTSWSPWLIAEPTTKVEISSVSNAVGSTYHWSGNIVGEGELEHKRLEPSQRVETELRFLRPMKSVCKTDFLLEPAGQGTKLTWSINGNLPWYLFWLKPMISTMVAMDYQRGLTMIKELAERGSIFSRTEVLGTEAISGLRVAGFKAKTSVFEVNASMSQVLKRLDSEFREEGLPLEGMLVAVYTRFDTKAGVFEYLLGRAIPETLVMPTHTKLSEWKQSAGRALHVRHTGSYKHLGNAWSVANRIAEHQKLRLDRCASYEIYTTTPPQTPEDELQTDIYLPLKR